MYKNPYSKRNASTVLPKGTGFAERADWDVFIEGLVSGVRPIQEQTYGMKPMDVVLESRRSFKIQRLDILRGRLTQLTRSSGN